MAHVENTFLPFLFLSLVVPLPRACSLMRCDVATDREEAPQAGFTGLPPQRAELLQEGHSDGSGRRRPPALSEKG